LAKRKKIRRKKAKRKTRKRISFSSSQVKVISGLVILAVLVAIAGFLTHYFMLRKHRGRPPAVVQKVPIYQEPEITPPKFEVFPEEELPYQPPISIPPDIKKLPRVAIIIDDLGYNRKKAQKFLELDAVLTFSILPYSPFTKKIAKAAYDKGMDVMLHLPMEPIEYPAIDPGPGVLLMSMSPDELIRQLKQDLDAVPEIKGVSSHMGSKMTAESDQMYQIFSVLKKRGLFFIDSRSTAHTVGRSSARLFKVPFAERDVFIDHKPNADFIRKQLKTLVRIAQKRGQAVGIAHPSKTTLKILRQELPELQKQVELVPVSQLVKIIG
jgi:polysaccharide deacetylase 2 family uncharacterized protein YibQ